MYKKIKIVYSNKSIVQAQSKVNMEVVNIRHAYRMSFFSAQKYFGNLWKMY